jgi:VIT1/CCC1 family predicted Fe2+/Mn2+ transporter
MPPHKNAYLERIRNESAYPWFRKSISLIATVITYLGTAIGVIAPLPAFSAFFGTGVLGVFTTVLFGLLLIAVGAILKEASIMVADIADSITDLNCRYEL